MTKLHLAALLLATLTTISAHAKDCPLRDAPLSVDSPLVDVVLSAPAMAALQREWPAAAKLPDWQTGIQPPPLPRC